MLKTSCHCEREQRAKQSAKYKLDFSLISAVFPAITKFSAKKRQNTAHAWQIASLVALARNDSRLLKKYPKTISIQYIIPYKNIRGLGGNSWLEFKE